MGSGLIGGGGGSSTAICLADADYGDISSSSCNLTVDADSVALTTDTTGNYAAGDAEAGNALSGDSATAFFSSGTMEAARLPNGDDDASTKGVVTFANEEFDCTTGSCTFATAGIDGGSGGELADGTVMYLDFNSDLLTGVTSITSGNTIGLGIGPTVSTYTGGSLLGYNFTPAVTVGTATPSISAVATNPVYTATVANSVSGLNTLSIAATSQSATANVPPFPMHMVLSQPTFQQTANSSIASSATTSFQAQGTIAANGGDLSVTDPNQLGYKEISGANTGTDQLTVTGHGYATGDGPVYVADGDKLCTAASTPFASCSGAQAGSAALPTGLSARTSYWVINIGANAIQLATSYANAIAGTPVVDITAAGTATNVIGATGTGLVGLYTLNSVSATSGKTASVDSMMGARIRSPSISGAGTVSVGHNYGIFIEDQANASITSTCAICSVGVSSPVKIAGKTQLGAYSDTGPSDTLEVTGNAVLRSGDVQILGDGGQVFFDVDATGNQVFVKFTDGTETVSGIWNLNDLPAGTYTMDNILSGIAGFSVPPGAVFNYTADPLFGGSIFFNASPTVRNSGSSRSAAWWYSFYTHPTYGSDGGGVTTTYEAVGDVDILPTFDATNSGAFAGERIGLNLGVAVAASDTFPKYTHIKIAKESGAGTLTEERGIDNASTYIATPTAQAIAAAGDDISCTSHLKTFTTATGTTTLTDNPIIADGVSGQICILTNIDATATDCLTFTDSTQGLQLAGNFTMCPNDVLTLLYNGTDWVEISRADS